MCDGGGHVVLGWEDIAGPPADFGAKSGGGPDEDGGLDGHVEWTDDVGSFEGPNQQNHLTFEFFFKF